MRFNRNRQEQADNTPPPLISYEKYSLDLNTISCSPSQPHYIALAGNHLHCFLHDRRMLGRDVARERGKPSISLSQMDAHDENVMDSATRCVRRFAPYNRFAMGDHRFVHITGCRISDANPNELIASWSGDHIYSFDLVQSPDVRDASIEQDRTLRQKYQTSQRRQERQRKRRRTGPANASTEGGEHTRTSSSPNLASDMRLDVSASVAENSSSEVDIMRTDEREAGRSIPNNRCERVARSVVKLRQSVLDSEVSGEARVAMTPHSKGSWQLAALTTALGLAADLLPEINDIEQSWSYPLNPSPGEVALQRTLRRHRQATWRFVQASGCLAIALGLPSQTRSAESDERSGMFGQIEPAQREGAEICDSERFAYDFLRAITLWLRSGPRAVVDGFRRRPDEFRDSPRFPLGVKDGPEVLHTKLVPYLLNLAQDSRPLVKAEPDATDTEETRILFPGQATAVHAFETALRCVELSDGYPGACSGTSQGTEPSSNLDLEETRRFWVFEVGRSLLKDVSEDIDYAFVRQAFDGSASSSSEDLAMISDDSEPIEAETIPVTVLNRLPSPSLESSTREDGVSTDGSCETHRAAAQGTEDENDGPDGSAPSPIEEDGEEEEDCPAENEEDEDDESPASYLLGGSFSSKAARERSTVELDKPFSSHTRVYKGSLNERTVKDCGFSGLNDEYVVSGSDCGRVFIWDRKTTKLVNILEGDGDVVNVVESHPHEPMLAVSGIENTVKIFSPDARLQADARRGINILNAEQGSASISSPFHMPGMRRPPRQQQQQQTRQRAQRELEQEQWQIVEGALHDNDNDEADSASEDEVASPNGLGTRRAMAERDAILKENLADPQNDGSAGSSRRRRRGAGGVAIPIGGVAQFAAFLESQGFQIRRVDTEDENGGDGDGDGGGDDRNAIVIDDQCEVSVEHFRLSCVYHYYCCCFSAGGSK